MTDELPQEELHQRDRIVRFLDLGIGPWTTIYKSGRDSDETYFAALAPKRLRNKAMQSDSWDMSIGGGEPGFVESYTSGRKKTAYLRFGSDDGFEPLILHQEHHGIKPDMLPQLSEEFRLYHNLWMNSDCSTLYKVHDDGNDEVVAKISHNLVQVRTYLLRQFQAGRQLDLYLYVDSRVNVDIELTEEQLQSFAIEESNPDHRYSLHAGTIRHGTSFSRLLGKKMLPAPAKKHAGKWPYDEGIETYPEFIIREDDMGNPVRHSCDPEKVGNYFGKNPDSPHYLTPVFFRREVLQRYYERSDRFSVEDGYLRCGSLWGVQIDNDIPNLVMVFLGDIGRDIPESDRLYWKSFNVPPTSGISETSFRRSFLSQPTDPSAPDLQFKHAYARFNQRWYARFGWGLFKPLVADDQHVLQRVRIPVNGIQPEFEDQIIGLTKILVDSLDEKAIIEQLSGERMKNERGIAKFVRWLTNEGYVFVKRDEAFLKRLQLLRSKSAAHRKGSDYREMLKKQGVDEDLVREVVMQFRQASRMLSDLSEHFGLEDATG